MVASKDEFQKRLKIALESSNTGSGRKVAKLAGLSPGQLHAWLSQQRNSARDHGPGAFSLARVCEVVGTDLNYLLGIDNQGRPSFNDVISSWENGSHRLYALDSIAEHFDVYVLPKEDDRTLIIHRLGKKSLATKRTGIIARRFFQETMNTFANEKKRREVISGYAKMSQKDLDLSIQTISVPKIAHLTKPVELRYQRLLLKVLGPDDTELVVNYSIEI